MSCYQYKFYFIYYSAALVDARDVAPGAWGKIAPQNLSWHRTPSLSLNAQFCKQLKSTAQVKFYHLLIN